MTTDDLAGSYITKARLALDTAKFLVERGGFSDAVRRSQEAVELAMKAALRSVGIEPPHWHDVGGVLLKQKRRFPSWFARKAPGLAKISSDLEKDREPAMYGDEDRGTTPDELYGEVYAKRAMGWAGRVVVSCERLLGRTVARPEKKGKGRKKPPS